MIKSIVLGICLWIPLLSFSQSGFPKKILLGKDSVICITFEQMVRANVEHQKAVMYKQFNDSLQKYLYDCMNVNKLLKQANAVYKRENDVDDEIITTQDTQIKELTKKNKGLKFGRWAFFGIGAGAVYLLMK